LIFKDGNYRTSALNPALALILQKNKDLQNEKAEDMIISENVSGEVARTGIEPATQGFSVLQNSFWTLPWITLDQPNSPDNTVHDSFFPEN
jgi:hypothetical protein